MHLHLLVRLDRSRPSISAAGTVPPSAYQLSGDPPGLRVEPVDAPLAPLMYAALSLMSRLGGPGKSH